MSCSAREGLKHIVLSRYVLEAIALASCCHIISYIQFPTNTKKSTFFSLTGNVHSLGRAEYGRLGLGENSGERKEPELVKLEGKSTDISAGSSVSFALMEDGRT